MVKDSRGKRNDMAEGSNPVDVIIIGAGLSGLAAAYHIKRRSPALR